MQASLWRCILKRLKQTSLHYHRQISAKLLDANPL